MKKEVIVKPISGYLAVVMAILFLGGAIAGFACEIIWLGVIHTLLFIFTVIGFTVVYPNGSCVMVLFGAYKGTIRENGFFWVNPFYIRRRISLRARNFNSEPIKVNDKIGNPIKIVEGAVSMVEMALEQLSVKKIVDLDEEKKAAMVSNLMVVLCGDKDATPIVNTGTLHS